MTLSCPKLSCRWDLLMLSDGNLYGELGVQEVGGFCWFSFEGVGLSKDEAEEAALVIQGVVIRFSRYEID